MTIAVCFSCGEVKHGATCACKQCGAKPATDDDLAVSFAMSDHYLSQAELESMGQRIKAEGWHPRLVEESLREMRKRTGGRGDASPHLAAKSRGQRSQADIAFLIRG